MNYENVNFIEHADIFEDFRLDLYEKADLFINTSIPWNI